MKGKNRSLTHVVEEESIQVLCKCFPKGWVTRRYSPDYGIDLAVEVFEPYDDGYTTLGEHIFFQAKGTESLTISKHKVYERKNVEKYAEAGGLYKEVDVVKFKIDTDLLYVVERMSSALPVILAVIDMVTHDVYFICLNDYIEKIINPTYENYADQESIVINIPINNKLNTKAGINLLRFYAKRPKLYALFNKINYQSHELNYDIDNSEIVKHFLKILLRSDAWNAANLFGPMYLVKEKIDFFIKNGITEEALSVIQRMKESGEDIFEKCWESSLVYGEMSLVETQTLAGTRSLWDLLSNMGNIFEDLTKEFALPTYINYLYSDE